MENLPPNWRFNFGFLTLAQRQAGPGIPQIADSEIQSAVLRSQHWYNSAAFPLSDNHYFLIGHTEKLRFLLVALSYSDDTFIIRDVAIADELQVQELTAAGPQAESPVVPGLTRKEAWDKLIATRQPVSKQEILQRMEEADRKRRASE